MPDHTKQTEIPHVIFSSSIRFCIIIIFSYRMQSLTTGKCVSYFSTYPSVLLPDSFIGNTTCTVNQEVSVT